MGKMKQIQDKLMSQGWKLVSIQTQVFIPRLTALPTFGHYYKWVDFVIKTDYDIHLDEYSSLIWFFYLTYKKTVSEVIGCVPAKSIEPKIGMQFTFMITNE